MPLKHKIMSKKQVQISHLQVFAAPKRRNENSTPTVAALVLTDYDQQLKTTALNLSVKQLNGLMAKANFVVANTAVFSKAQAFKFAALVGTWESRAVIEFEEMRVGDTYEVKVDGQMTERMVGYDYSMDPKGVLRPDAKDFVKSSVDVILLPAEVKAELRTNIVASVKSDWDKLDAILGGGIGMEGFDSFDIPTAPKVDIPANDAIDADADVDTDDADDAEIKPKRKPKAK